MYKDSWELIGNIQGTLWEEQHMQDKYALNPWFFAFIMWVSDDMNTMRT